MTMKRDGVKGRRLRDDLGWGGWEVPKGDLQVKWPAHSALWPLSCSVSRWPLEILWSWKRNTAGANTLPGGFGLSNELIWQLRFILMDIILNLTAHAFLIVIIKYLIRLPQKKKAITLEFSASFDFQSCNLNRFLYSTRGTPVIGLLICCCHKAGAM